MDYGFVLEARAESARLGQAVCPNCMPQVAAREFETSVRPLMRREAQSPFEQACAAAFNRSLPLRLMGSARDAMLSWEYGEWRGPYLAGISVGEFAHEFVTSARRRGVAPNGVLKLGMFKKPVAHLIINRDTDGWTSDALYVTVDGSTAYQPPQPDGKPIPKAANEVIQIPPGTATALGIDR